MIYYFIRFSNNLSFLFQQNVKQTPLSRCLKRTDTITIETLPEQQLKTVSLKQNSTEVLKILLLSYIL